MKRFKSLAIAAMATMCAWAAEPSDLIIYINPGHGGYDSDDRVITLYPFADGDTSTFAESKSNLGKGFRLRELLWEKGYNVVMSRVTNTTEDDLGLTTIGRLANNAGSDLFLSIHSNATGTTNRVNFPIIFFRGYDDQPVYPEAKVWATEIDNHLLTNNATIWTSTNPNVRGDWSFQPSWGTQGYGVLRALTIPGALSEGSFHDYYPETYRLLSSHYHWIEAWNFRKAVNQHYSVAGVDYGGIAGRVNDERVLRSADYKMYKEDLLAPIHNAVVELWTADGATKLEECVTDELFNGMYSFRKVTPGNYKLKFSSETHYASEADVEVVADEITYANLKMKKVRNTPPAVLSHSPIWAEDSAAVLCNSPIVINFNWDMDVELTEAAFSIEPAVEGTITWEDQNYRMVFTPNGTYDISTLYTVKLAKTAQHGGGMEMEEPYEFQFFTTDRNFMTITGMFPNAGDAVHYKGAQIEARFDKIPNVTPILKQVKVYDSTGAEVSLNKRSMKYSKSDAEYGYFRIPFTNSLTVGETYTLKLSAEIADKDGITLQDSVVVQFDAVDAGEAKTHSIIDEMQDATIYVQDDQGSANLSEASTIATNTSQALFATDTDKKCLAFTYAFTGEEGGELLWTNSQPVEIAAESTDALGVHIYGDLTANEVYVQMSSEEDVKYVKVCNMTFLGWRYLEVPMSNLEGGKTYKVTGIKLIQTPSNMSRTATFYLDNLMMISGGVGVEEIVMPELTVYPNPASELLIADAGGIVDRIDIVGADGVVAATANGNVLNVTEVPNGTYFARIYTDGGYVVRKVVVKH